MKTGKKEIKSIAEYKVFFDLYDSNDSEGEDLDPRVRGTNLASEAFEKYKHSLNLKKFKKQKT